MIKEETVRAIMTIYFKNNDIKAVPTSGAGPDFLEGGKAIEVKGSNADFGKAVTQYCSYLLTGRFKDLAIAFPADLLNSENLVRLSLFCRIASTLYKYVETYLVVERENGYYLRKFSNGDQVLSEVVGKVSSRYDGMKDNQAKVADTAKKELRDTITTIQGTLVDIVTERPDLIVGKETLQDG